MATLISRPATMADAQLLFNWRTDLLARTNSLTSTDFDYSSHLQWLEQSLDNPDRRILIYFSEKEAIGMGRADHLEDSYLLSWTIAPDFRGQGHSVELVRDLVDKFSPAIAKIKRGNSPSLRIAERLGFAKIDEAGDVFTYRKD